MIKAFFFSAILVSACSQRGTDEPAEIPTVPASERPSAATPSERRALRAAARGPLAPAPAEAAEGTAEVHIDECCVCRDSIPAGDARGFGVFNCHADRFCSACTRETVAATHVWSNPRCPLCRREPQLGARVFREDPEPALAAALAAAPVGSLDTPVDCPICLDTHSAPSGRFGDCCPNGREICTGCAPRVESSWRDGPRCPFCRAQETNRFPATEPAPAPSAAPAPAVAPAAIVNPAVQVEQADGGAALSREAAAAGAAAVAAIAEALPGAERRIGEVASVAAQRVAADVGRIYEENAPFARELVAEAIPRVEAEVARLADQGRRRLVARLTEPDALAVQVFLAPLLLNGPIQAWAELLQVSPRRVTMALVMLVASELYRHGLIPEAYKQRPELNLAVAAVVVGLMVL